MQLEELRRKRLDELAGLIQKTFRGWSARRFYLRQRACAIRIVRAWKQYKVIRRAVIIIITALSHSGIKCYVCRDDMCLGITHGWANQNKPSKSRIFLLLGDDRRDDKMRITVASFDVTG